MGNLVAIVGRPNVGKSTLFNRLTKTRQAIVNDEAGTTRDRQYGKSEWLGREFSVVDTGGWVVNSDDIFEEEIRKQVLMAVDEADVILFVVDVTNGVTDLDMQVAAILRRAKSPVIMVANKTDNHELRYNAPEFYRLGLGDPYCISAISGSGTGDLMDLIVSKFKKESDEILDEDIPRFAVVGRPNAGKSSLLNALAGREAAIVTDIAGTTRDVLREHIHIDGMPLHIIDTAGLREASDEVERIGIERAWQEIEQADRVLFMVDGTTTDAVDPAEIWPEFIARLPAKLPITVVRNKADITGETLGISEVNGHALIRLSARTGEGVDVLRNHLKQSMGFDTNMEGGFLARRRHLQALEQAAEHLQQGKAQLLGAWAGELLAEELRLAQQNLSEITGEFTSDDLLGRIFSSFCIGK